MRKRFERKRRSNTAAARRLVKRCVVCGRSMKIILYRGGTYRGGHYFGKIPRYRKRETQKALKAGTRKSKLGTMTIQVLKQSPKPYAYVEYWECPKCYWGS